MSLFAVCLVVISAFLHAGWNLLSKNNKSSGKAFFLSSSAAASLLLTPYVLWYLNDTDYASLSLSFWWVLVISGVAQVIYLISLSFAYKYGDIGVIYPIARALPVLMVGVGTALLGYHLSLMVWVGFGFITIGCLLVPLLSLKQFHISDYANVGVLWALVAAVGTTGYSILDKEALVILAHELETVTSEVQSAIFYLALQFWVIFAVISVYLIASRQWGEFSAAWQIRKPSAMAGAMMATTYGLVLYAMTMTDNVSYVVALRQTSIVFGLILGVVFLKERFALTRCAGTGLIFIGLVMTVI
ncbi:EamA family transporter [Vibrio brasiliensis]|uniref:EamA family transporter n=1 Tax=Vibrio brasiliensis TaxID=170652 RepID=UPI001EFD824A|nr:EamA family transporter [Vibrio brasiliensis]MCG9648001.1 EamA family transporter [Vibrio brasiliensis]